MAGKCYVWGTGLLARQMLEAVTLSVDAFIDSNAEKQGGLFMGKPVLAPDEASISGNRVVIASIYYAEIYDTILALGGGAEHICIGSDTEVMAPDVSADLIARHRRHQAWVAGFIEGHMPGVRDFGADREAHLRHAVQAATEPGLVLEFGVFQGASLKVLADAAAQPVYGFDSFEGLPEDWTLFHRQRFFDLKGNQPEVGDGIHLVKGYFQDTLDAFLAAHIGPLRLLHCDADLYSSTSYVLERCAPRLVAGSVIILDDYLYELDYERCDWRAFTDFCERFDAAFEYLSREDSGSVALRLTRAPAQTGQP
jgi:predicted O-methyltransferase YrrM